MSPVLAGRFLTTQPPGKSLICTFCCPESWVFNGCEDVLCFGGSLWRFAVWTYLDLEILTSPVDILVFLVGVRSVQCLWSPSNPPSLPASVTSLKLLPVPRLACNWNPQICMLNLSLKLQMEFRINTPFKNNTTGLKPPRGRNSQVHLRYEFLLFLNVCVPITIQDLVNHKKLEVSANKVTHKNISIDLKGDIADGDCC